MFKDVKDEKIDFDIGRTKKGTLFLSNSIEVLFEHLNLNLFSAGGIEDVFAERMLIVPSLGIQQWIQMRLATTLSISCGINPTFLNKGIDILREKLFCTEKNNAIPSQLELFLLIEREMEEACTSNEPIWAPLTSYIQGKERRKIALAKQLTQLFIRYGIYGNKNCHEWETKPQNWQQQLWSKVYQQAGYPQKHLLNLRSKTGLDSAPSVHLFAFSHLSPLHLHFFSQVARHTPLFIYHLSPCQEFWSDLSPAQEEENGHPLLISLGRVGRESAKQFEEAGMSTEECYILFGGDTQLKKLQRNLVMLEPPQTACDDGSVQIHISATRHREIENLHHLLLDMLSKSGAEPKDVLVMAPQIADYAPYIKAIFGNSLPYQITDLPLQKNDLSVDGLFHLFELERKRWSASALFELFNNPLFQRKHSLAPEEILQIKKWARQTGVRWGVDAQHRDELLKKRHCKQPPEGSSATWLESFGYLIEELALSPTISSLQKRIDFSQAELLGKVITLITTLQEDLKQLDKRLTLQEWVCYFRKLHSDYFAPFEEGALLTILERLERLEKAFEKKKYSFSVILNLLNEITGQESATINRNLCQAVRFCSMLPMRAIPAKIICLIGMNHDDFPRREQLGQLDMLKLSKHIDYSPSRVDFDRYLFLEAILSARETLIVSYHGTDPYDLSEIPPSSIVTEFLPLVSPKSIFKHPIHNRSNVSFSEEVPFAAKCYEPPALPEGEYTIDLSELKRLVRSPLAHFLGARQLKISHEEELLDEEAFVLTPLERALMRKDVVAIGPEAAFKKAQREGKIPPALFGNLAQMQIQEEMAALPADCQTKLELPPLTLKINETLSVTFTGTLEGVFETGLCVPYACDFKSAVKCWPSFLLLQAADPGKRELLFIKANKTKTAFFDDAAAYLKELVNLYFYAEQNPLYLCPEWIESILEKNPEKAEQTPVFETYLRWQLTGRERFDYAALVENDYPLVEKLYKGMFDAWF